MGYDQNSNHKERNRLIESSIPIQLPIGYIRPITLTFSFYTLFPLSIKGNLDLACSSISS